METMQPDRTQQTFRLTAVGIVSGIGQPLNAPGAADEMTTRSTRKVLAKLLPDAEVKYFPGEGHLSLIHKYLKIIFGTLMG